MSVLLESTLAFIQRNWISLAIICAFSYIVLFLIRWYGKLSVRETSILFAQGIIVIVIMFFLQWSINSSGTGASQDINVFLFQVEVKGKNFLNTFQEAWETQAHGITWSVFGSKLLPAFLEELFKFLMVVFFLKNSTRKILTIIIAIIGFNAILSQGPSGNMLAGLIFLAVILGSIWLFFSHKIQHLSSINHCIYVIAIVAAGFAFGENIKYLADHEKIMMGNTAIASGLDPTIYLSQLSFLRSIFGNISHVLFSAVVGYFFARGIFGAFDIIDSHRASKQTTWLRFLGAKQFVRIYLFKMSIIGLIIATLVHTVYNFFMSGEQLFGFGGMPGVIITLLVGVGVFEMYVLRERRYVTDYGSIAEKIELGQQIRQVKGKQR